MKPVLMHIAITGVLLLGGCGAVGVLEEENTDLQTKVDSLSVTQHQMKQRMAYLEQENMKLDNRNEQLKQRIEETGSLTPPDFTVTNEQPMYAEPAPVTAVPQARRQQPPQNIEANPQVVQPDGRQQSISPNPGAAPWQAERKAIESGAANPTLDEADTWTYGSGGNPSSGYTYNDDSPSSKPGGYTYNSNRRESGTTSPENWQYNSNPSGKYESDYSREFDTRQQAERKAWDKARRQTSAQRYPATPSQPATPQALYERQAREQIARQTQTTSPPVPKTAAPSRPLPPARVSVSRSEAARPADYSYLAAYQKGYDAYHAGRYRESIDILTDLAASSEMNNTSDNCDFWIAEAYYALGEYTSAKVYYSRVISYPRSDKADEARTRLRRLQ